MHLSHCLGSIVCLLLAASLAAYGNTVRVMLYSEIVDMPAGRVEERDAAACQQLMKYQVEKIGTLLIEDRINITTAVAISDATATDFYTTGQCNTYEGLLNSTLGPMRNTSEIFNHLVDCLVALESNASLCSTPGQEEACLELKRQVYSHEAFLVVLIRGRIIIDYDLPRLSEYTAYRRQYIEKISQARNGHSDHTDCVVSKPKPKPKQSSVSPVAAQPPLVSQVSVPLSNDSALGLKPRSEIVLAAVGREMPVRYTCKESIHVEGDSLDQVCLGSCLKKKILSKISTLMAPFGSLPYF